MKYRDVYFSLWVPGETSAKIYKYDRSLLQSLPRGAWHRFAIVCEGEQAIRCYVDSRETNFSPLKDSSLQDLQVGVMLADKNEDSAHAVCAEITAAGGRAAACKVKCPTCRFLELARSANLLTFFRLAAALSSLQTCAYSSRDLPLSCTALAALEGCVSASIPRFPG